MIIFKPSLLLYFVHFISILWCCVGQHWGSNFLPACGTSAHAVQRSIKTSPALQTQGRLSVSLCMPAMWKATIKDKISLQTSIQWQRGSFVSWDRSTTNTTGSRTRPTSRHATDVMEKLLRSHQHRHVLGWGPRWCVPHPTSAIFAPTANSISSNQLLVAKEWRACHFLQQSKCIQ